jgi:hypothetical protein
VCDVDCQIGGILTKKDCLVEGERDDVSPQDVPRLSRVYPKEVKRVQPCPDPRLRVFGTAPFVVPC